MKIIYLILKGVKIAFILLAMYFISRFWLGLKEDWDDKVQNDFWAFFFARLSATLLIGFLFLLSFFIINRLLHRKLKIGKFITKKIFLMELLFFFVAAVLLVTTALMR